MKTVFLNPFLPTDLNEKVTSVSFKIGSFDYIAKHANVKTTEIDFDKRIIQINDALDSTASLRELVRAFFIIVLISIISIIPVFYVQLFRSELHFHTFCCF